MIYDSLTTLVLTSLPCNFLFSILVVSFHDYCFLSFPAYFLRRFLIFLRILMLLLIFSFWFFFHSSFFTYFCSLSEILPPFLTSFLYDLPPCFELFVFSSLFIPLVYYFRFLPPTCYLSLFLNLSIFSLPTLSSLSPFLSIFFFSSFCHFHFVHSCFFLMSAPSFSFLARFFSHFLHLSYLSVTFKFQSFLFSFISIYQTFLL